MQLTYDTISDNSWKVDSAQEGVRVDKQTDQELPNTSGISTMPFYVLGNILATESVLMLVVKHRMHRTGDGLVFGRTGDAEQGTG